ncbi:NACHT domain-containing protein [Actinokineospora sp. 24-640]
MDAMASAPPLTYRGALRLLGKTDQRILKSIDGLLGGLILASPATAFAAAWGFVDQKNEAVGLTRSLLDATSARMNQVGGFERHELITAAHAVIVVAAYFDSFRTCLKKDEYRELALTDQEKALLATGARNNGNADQFVGILSTAAIPVPLAGGLGDNDVLRAFYSKLQDGVLIFLDGLKAWPRIAKQSTVQADIRQIPMRAAKRYTSYFLDLARDVPEFYLWASLSDSAQTSRALDESHGTLRVAIEKQATSLGRLQEVLAQLNSSRADPGSKARSSVNRANRSALTDPIISGGMLDHIGPVELPTIEEIYQNPRFRTTRASVSRPADENWWRTQEILDDFDLFIAAYLSSPQSVLEPLLILGHPGAGKSLLARVLAARLPDWAFTTVRVPLRRVDAQAPILDQIQQALDAVTNRRVSWTDLVDEDYYTSRVVILDGLDELLQASTTSRSAYLQDVAEFQRREADQDRPIAVIVTSRTVVADRVRISPSSTIVKLEGFDDGQIGKWLTAWRDRNRDAIGTQRIGELTLAAALEVRDLACQPLLLLMLALYASDPEAEEIGPRLSGASFYGRILTSFVQREVNKAGEIGRLMQIEDLVEDQMWRLGIAAFAMFNRDQLYIKDHELGADLIALTVSDVADSRTASLLSQVGQETIGKFFFVYTPEVDSHRPDDMRRAFEFLHATFGEYLVAHFCVRLLTETVERPKKSWQGGRGIDDDLLFALLSHQTLTTRRTVVNFIRELISQIDPTIRRECVAAIQKVLDGYRTYTGVRIYSQYRPIAVDRVREMAAYSANLVLLKVLFADDCMIRIETTAPPVHGEDWWRSTVSLWRHTLGSSAWESICRTIDLDNSGRLTLREGEHLNLIAEATFLRFTKNDGDRVAYHIGAAVLGRPLPTGSEDPVIRVIGYLFYWAEQSASPDEDVVQLYLNAAGEIGDLEPPLAALLKSAISRYLFRRHGKLLYAETLVWIRLYFRSACDEFADISLFALYVAKYTRLIDDVPELRSARGYKMRWVPALFLAAEKVLHKPDRDDTSAPLLSELRLRELRRRIERELRLGEHFEYGLDAFVDMVRYGFARQ